MNKLLVAACVAALGAAACSSGNANTKTADGRNTASSKDAKYQIIDQEFDNLLAPDADYDTIPDYELQACGDSYLPPATTPLKGATKPAAKKVSKTTTSTTATKSSSNNVTTNKKIVTNTNIYYLDNPASAAPATQTYTSEEALPASDVPDTI